MKTGIGLAIGLVMLTGCMSLGKKGPIVTADDSKWKGEPYRLVLDKPAGKPNPAAISIPGIEFTANPEALERRAILVMRFSGGKDSDSHTMVGTPVDISGEKGALPASYLDMASKGLTDYLGAHCIQGDVKVSVALARSSVKPQAEDTEVDAKRLSDWTPFETVFKKPHAKC